MKILKKSFAIVLVTAMAITGINTGNTDAAGKPRLNKSKMKMTVGKEYTLKVQSSAKKAKVTWKTSNKKSVKIVSKVTGGVKASAVIRAVKKGSSKITANYKFGKKKYVLKCRVTVSNAKESSGNTNKTGSLETAATSVSTVLHVETDVTKVSNEPEKTAVPGASYVPADTDIPEKTDTPGASAPVEQTPSAATATTPAALPPTAKATMKPTITPTPTPTATTTATYKPQTSPGGNASGEKWVTTWGTAEEKNDINADRMPQLPLNNSTIRQIIKVTTSGDKIKLRLSNQYGQSDVVIKSMHIAKQVQADKSTIDTSTDTVVTVGGKESFTIPKGKLIETDGVTFHTDALDNIAVSMYFESGPSNNITGHRGARATSYQVAGNSVSAKEFASPKTTTSWFFLADASLMSPACGRAVVCFGDSITDGYGTDADYLGKKPDSYTRWGDYFARRLQANEKTKNVAVINEGIGSNSILGSYPTDAGKDRFLRDLTQHDGVAYCIILFGVNDLNKLWDTSRFNQLKPEYEKMVSTCHQYGIKVYGAPILPFGTSDYYSESSEKVRNMINEWMRNTAVSGFDGIIDFEGAVWDPNNHKNILEKYTHSDGLHPYDGYEVMANAIDLSLFEDYDPNTVPVIQPTPSVSPDDPIPLPSDKPYEFKQVTDGIAIDMSSYNNMAGTGDYDSLRSAVVINDSSAQDKSQGTWVLPNTIPSIKEGDVVTFRVQGYNYGTSGFRFWIGSDVSGCSTPVMLVEQPDNNQLIDKNLGYPCEKDSSGNVLTPSTRNTANGKVTYNQMAIGADADTHAFDVTFSFKAGISQNDTNGVCSNLTLKYIFGGDTSGYINGLVIKNIYYIK